MGTSCYIGLEDKNLTVEYIYVHFDGYFSSIVPILREYKKREDVKKMIRNGLCSLSNLNDTDSKMPPQINVSRSIYSLVDLANTPGTRVFYIYVFTKEDEWLCHNTVPYFSIDELKY